MKIENLYIEDRKEYIRNFKVFTVFSKVNLSLILKGGISNFQKLTG